LEFIHNFSALPQIKTEDLSNTK